VLIGYFTEMPNSRYPEQEALKSHPTDHPAVRPGDTVLLFSNRFLDVEDAALCFDEHYEAYRFAEDVGFDALMFNEHHAAPFCMQARCNITTAVAAGMTKRVKLLQLGNPLPLADNPVQLAEEVAMLDLISGGRMIAGIVRGGGQEQIVNNVSPLLNRARFQEAHDLMLAAWTRPGPFRWEGEEYQLRVVNPWALPLQKPHPRIMVPGVSSPDTVTWAAEHAYPYVCLGTTIDETLKIKEIYAAAAARVGYEAKPEHLGYVMRCQVADTEAEARINAQSYLWMRGEFTGVGQSTWSAPTGYSSIASRKARILMYKTLFTPLDDQIERGSIVCGTPEQVIERIGEFLEKVRPGTLVLWGHDGKIPHKAAMRGLELFGEKVVPAVREIADGLGLQSPFEADAPVSLAAMAGAAG
jgi:alkanesulfonate monooxygenase SsuD/methylene tetrahydromethanopterin reductase-like flavin-dependent oxidoreductase (luciferase family)